MTLIDTAEMYGDRAAERLVGAAIQSFQREDLNRAFPAPTRRVPLDIQQRR